MDGNNEKKQFWYRVSLLWRFLVSPSVKYSLGAILIAGFVAGILFWGGFHWAMELSNTESFCISCHEMEDNVYKEYKDTIHFNNRTGVRATCPDCHVPKEWAYKVARKVRATNELFHHIIGTVDTPEKFENKRLELARHVWDEMKANNSRECRNCHVLNMMDFGEQEGRAARKHKKANEKGETCIDCHKGIAHELPEGYEEDGKEGE